MKYIKIFVHFFSAACVSGLRFLNVRQWVTTFPSGPAGLEEDKKPCGKYVFLGELDLYMQSPGPDSIPGVHKKTGLPVASLRKKSNELSNIVNSYVQKFLKLPAAFLLLVGVLLTGVSVAPAAGESLEIDIYGPGQSSANLFIAPLISAENGPWKDVGEQTLFYLEENLSFLPFLNQFNGTEIIGGADISGYQARDIDFKRLGLSKVDILITSMVKKKEKALAGIELRAFDVFSGRMLLGKGYSPRNKEQVKLAARKFSADLLEELTGEGDLFFTDIAFACKGDNGVKEICLTSLPGGNVRQLTELRGISTSPAFSGDGSRIVFSYLSKDRHRLGIWKKNPGEVETLEVPGTICISPVFDPSGQIVASLNPYGNPDICSLDTDSQGADFIVKNWGIDVSPSFDRSGRKMAFVSSRMGNPHIFLLDRKTDEIKRVTYAGKYNTSPTMSPNGNMLAYSGRTDNGHRIFVHDLRSGMERQVTFGPKSDEEPSFGPNGYFIVFSSNRDGKYRLYITTINGAEPRLVPTGSREATNPSWSWARSDD